MGLIGNNLFKKQVLRNALFYIHSDFLPYLKAILNKIDFKNVNIKRDNTLHKHECTHFIDYFHERFYIIYFQSKMYFVRIP